MTDDQTLLRRFAENQDERAFTELVSRHLGMVRGICHRRTGDAQLAEELTQNVFSTLARKAGRIGQDVLISGWLHRASCFESLHALRSEASRKRTMKKFEEFQPIAGAAATEVPPDLVPVLDEAIDAMASGDRNILLLRFASGLTLRQIGEKIGKSESASQRHLQRALEKLRGLLRKRGVAVGAVTLATFLGTDFAKAATGKLVISTVSRIAIAQASMGGAVTTATFTSSILILMKQKIVIAGAVCLLAAAGSVVLIKQNSSTPDSGPGLTDARRSGSQQARGGSAAASLGDPGFEIQPRQKRAEKDFAELVSRFGESRVNVAKNATDSLIEVTDLISKLAETAENIGGTGPLSSSNPSSEIGKLVAELQLTEAQISAVDEIETQRHKEFAETLRNLPANLRDNKEKIIELMLAGDSRSRGEISDDEYTATLRGTENYLAPFTEGPRLEIAQEEWSEILDNDQMKRWKELDAEKQTQQPSQRSNPERDMLSAALPSFDKPVSIEELDKKLSHTKTAMNGAMMMIDAMSGLEEMRTPASGDGSE